MLLAVDIGNTSTTIGVFAGEELRATWRIGTDSGRTADEYGMLLLTLLHHQGLDPDVIADAVAASVVPDLDPLFQAACHRYLHGIDPLMVGAGIRTGLRILYEDPREVGADRVVDAVAALSLYGPPLVVVDLGTATVFDAINAQGEYVGGAIAPGVAIAAEALFRRAAKLYRVELKRPRSAIGRNTAAALQSGFVYGDVGLIEGVVARFKQELGGQATVVATGGWVEAVARECSVIDIVNPDLPLIGLRLIYDLNRGERSA
ncbi:MAG: type III pantothenate kinase [Dehalococcoidia bacterium]